MSLAWLYCYIQFIKSYIEFNELVWYFSLNYIFITVTEDAAMPKKLFLQEREILNLFVPNMIKVSLVLNMFSKRGAYIY